MNIPKKKSWGKIHKKNKELCTHTTRRNIFVYVDNLICADVSSPFFSHFFFIYIFFYFDVGERRFVGLRLAIRGGNLLSVDFLAAALCHLAVRFIGLIDSIALDHIESMGSMRSSDRAKAVSCLSAFINKLWQLNK